MFVIIRQIIVVITNVAVGKRVPAAKKGKPILFSYIIDERSQTSQLPVTHVSRVPREGVRGGANPSPEGCNQNG